MRNSKSENLDLQILAGVIGDAPLEEDDYPGRVAPRHSEDRDHLPAASASLGDCLAMRAAWIANQAILEIEVSPRVFPPVGHRRLLIYQHTSHSLWSAKRVPDWSRFCYPLIPAVNEE